jgi:signal transduction histidine kinase
VVEVEDDGRGLDKTALSGVGADGLGNMAWRMEQLQGRFDCLAGKEDHGIRIVFTIPLV